MEKKKNNGPQKKRSGKKRPQSKGNRSNNRNNSRRRNNSSRRSRNQKDLNPEKVKIKYDNLMEQHLIARRKLYEMHARLDGKKREKLDYNFLKTLQEIENFVGRLKPEQKEALDKRVDGLPWDTEYSTNHDLPVRAEHVSFSGDFEDPHLLPSQADSDYSQDTEESSGTMEDYEAYKASKVS